MMMSRQVMTNQLRRGMNTNDTYISILNCCSFHLLLMRPSRQLTYGRKSTIPVSMLSPSFWRPLYASAVSSIYLAVDIVWDRIRSTIGLISTAVGFVGNFLVDASAKEKRAIWSAVFEKLVNYLDDSGIKEELSKGMNLRFFSNLTIIDNIQKALHLDRRLHCKHEEDHGIIPRNSEAATFMRYATAAYGSEMIASAWLETDEHRHSLTIDTVDDILTHTGVTAEDIVVMDVDYGEDPLCLRHFCVVDHANKAVVLAIRGTFSMTGVMVDLVGYCEPFCDGEAHSGMGHMAKAVWAKSGPAITEALSKLPSHYEFIITGHSLGAGVACLLNILVYHENVIPPANNVRCFAYAPPPTFHPVSAAPAAVQNTIAYVHQRDIVPFLSVNAVRRFFSLLLTVDKTSQHLYWWEKACIDWNFSKPTPAMIEAARECHQTDLPKTAGAAILVIPARAAVWLEKERHECFNQHVCCTQKLTEVGILVNPDMIADHGPAKYEAAFKYLKEEEQDEFLNGTVIC